MVVMAMTKSYMKLDFTSTCKKKQQNYQENTHSLSTIVLNEPISTSAI